MRLRNKPWTNQFLIDQKKYLISWDHKSQLMLEKCFDNNYPIQIEIGCGKGDFITNKAMLNPQFNYIGIEKETTVVGVALKKSLAMFEQSSPTIEPLVNLRYFNDFAENLLDIFPTNSIDKIYLNFSDPWPKAKHYKKRLTYITFLNMYADVLQEHGFLEMKTDNDGLFDFTLQQLQSTDRFIIIYQSIDLYNDKNELVNNIATEYETKFHNLGKNINKLIIQKVK